MKRLSVFLLWLLPALSVAQDVTLTLPDIFTSRKFSVANFSEKWLGGSAFLQIDADTSNTGVTLYKVNARRGNREPLVKAGTLQLHDGKEPLEVFNPIVSPDQNFILLTALIAARREKSGGDLYLYSIKEQSFKPLAVSAEEQRHVKFSPDSKKIGFVRSNNIFVMDLLTGKETQLTKDGSATVLNGTLDWVYEEEFELTDGWRWSPDSKFIAFWRLDQSRVPTFAIPTFDDIHATTNEMHYPKAGDPNAEVSIGIVNTGTGETQFIELGADKDIYIPRIDWTRQSGLLAYQKLNRLQNKLDLYLYDVAARKSRLILTEQDAAWIDVTDAYKFLSTADEFIWPSDRNGFTHFYLYDYKGNVIKQLTDGAFDCDELLFVDESDRTFYFTSAETALSEHHLYAASLQTGERKQLTTESGTHRISFSPDGSLFVDAFSNLTTPTMVSLYNKSGSLVRHLTSNGRAVKELQSLSLSKPSFFKFKTTLGDSLAAYMIRPADFDSTKKYPVLIYVYGGPGSQTVVNAWDGWQTLWHDMLTQKGYIVMSVDGRGTGFRGRAFKKQTYLNLGSYETQDLIETAKYLRTQCYVDGTRIGIWGWSYGGYLSTLAIMEGWEYFKAAVAVAPVTHWEFYDTIYTERYMRTPTLNPNGYGTSSPLTYAMQLRGNFLLIHGLADDNVHFQNSAALAELLQSRAIPFQTMFYTGKEHNISGSQTRLHLFTLMTAFLLEKL
jgi:dipeptidyl-peptidase-4